MGLVKLSSTVSEIGQTFYRTKLLQERLGLVVGLVKLSIEVLVKPPFFRRKWDWSGMSGVSQTIDRNEWG